MAQIDIKKPRSGEIFIAHTNLLSSKPRSGDIFIGIFVISVIMNKKCPVARSLKKCLPP